MRRRTVVALAVVVVGVLWYLRDPPWLIRETTGLRDWQRGGEGRLVRWSGSHASFFVPSHARAVRVPIATRFDAREPGGDRPMLVTFSIDERRVQRVVLSDAAWREVVLPLPPPGTRRVRRVEIRTNILREGNRGVQVGEVLASMDGREWRPCCFSSR